MTEHRNSANMYINVNQLIHGHKKWLISLIPCAISEKCVFLCSNNWVKKQPPELFCKKVNISKILQENTCEICEIFKNTYFEEHIRTAASMGCLFCEVSEAATGGVL